VVWNFVIIGVVAVVTPTDLAAAAFERALESKKMVIIKGGQPLEPAPMFLGFGVDLGRGNQRRLLFT
jgi:hypothetical protein